MRKKKREDCNIYLLKFTMFDIKLVLIKSKF
jgi:hypothetical protein